ncbi:2TM domain-containing protein [Aliiruegeria haliotis]|uniref:2TM domain-containing protein n=1 Tax=Aliiruegeria haliotis TaxID=1280846 RepID=A0A2T0REH6_9RHOB|nr:2TM domain-containing protein [Aliiruegeria haliotis]PRY19594.1 2TM domain-containing protein [Aliiruegeria haliotis]
MTQTRKYALARQRAEAKYGFFVHAGVYVAVMVLLVVINVLTAPETLWSIWPMMGWGLAVVLHGIRVFRSGGKNTILDALTEDELRCSEADRHNEGT